MNNDLGFFLAPQFNYLLAPFYILTNLHPAGMLIFQIFLNSTFFFLAYVTVAKLFSNKHALFFLFLWTINYILQDLETIAWSPLLIPTGVMLLWFLEDKLFKKPQETKLWLLTGVTAGFFINMHFQFVFILTQLGLFGLFLKLKNNKSSYKNIAVCMGAFATMFIPLLIFDLRNNFLNLRLFLNYFFKTDEIYNVRFYDWSFILSNMFQPYIFIKTKAAGFIMLAGLVSAVLYLWRRSSGFRAIFYLSNGIMIAMSAVAFNILAVRPSEYYFIFLVPIFVIALVDLALTRKLFYPLIALCTLYVVANASTLEINLHSNMDSLQYKDQLINDVQKQVGSRKFFIFFDGPPGSDGGFRYLIKIRKLNSSSDGKNPQIQVKSPAPDSKHAFGGYGVIIPEILKR